MRKPVSACLLLTASLLAASPAWGQIYKCVNEDNHPTYTNVPVDKKCVKMQIESDAPPSTATTTVRTRGAAATPTPVDFPRVSADTQKARDNDRRAILNQELSAELQSLNAARAKLAAEEKTRAGNEKNAQKREDRLQPFREEVASRERNIEAINKELANLR
ncbi:MAG: DUF4124 domain-containing protein [Zoogloeaceae bacterium]|nr:DUF4124 domain-containing protein [Zoogloeaceae bacterium]